MKLSDFDYELPPDRIAQRPAPERDLARLLVHDVAADATVHARVRDLPRHLRAGDLLVLNDTRVLASRFFGRRQSGGRVELLLLEPVGPGTRWSALVHPARKLAEGEVIALEGGALRARMVARPRDERGEAVPEWHVELLDAGGAPLDPLAACERHGHVPLPPYVERPRDVPAWMEEGDRERYQTVFAERPGAVAAPTAGLHFTPELLERLAADGVGRARVTLHVGLGTFRPIQSARVEEHRMHAERFELPLETVDLVRETKRRGGRVVAVGTTSVRVLEGVAARGELAATRGTTDLFLLPGSPFRVVDALFTNFHLPRSSLLVLVSAFAGRERVLRLYREALEEGYRFYSYGDAMLLCSRPNGRSD